MGEDTGVAEGMHTHGHSGSSHLLQAQYTLGVLTAHQVKKRLEACPVHSIAFTTILAC